MRAVAHGVAWFRRGDAGRVKELMLAYCSARRSAYQDLQRGLKINDTRKQLKRNYAFLGQRYINDAVSEAGKIVHPHAIFGGRRAWSELRAGRLSKQDWSSRRNDTLYSRGDRSKKGNPNLRIAGNELWVNDPSTRGLWLRGKLWLNASVPLDCYEVRVQLSSKRFKVTVSWEVPDVAIITSEQGGMVGLDVNPDGIALVETNKEGCVLHHHYISSGRAMFARSGKRSYDVRQAAVQAVDYAIRVGKHISLEKLKFKNKASKARRFNRMRHNFLHRQLIEAIKSRATRSGVGVVEVNPAFTSVVGNLKYAHQYSLNRHTAAALVISRHGLELNEVVKVKASVGEKKQVTLEGRSCQIALSERAFSWMKHLYDVRPKPPGVTPPHPDAGNDARQVMLARSTGRGVIGATTGQLRHWDDT